MELHIKKVLAEAIGFASLAKFGFDKAWDNWKKSDSIDLARKDDDELERLASLLEKHKAKRGVGVLLRDIATWRSALADDPTAVKARTVPQFETLLATYLAATPRKHLYWRQDDGTMECVYVNKLLYHPADRDRRTYSPAYVEIHVIWKELGGAHSQRFHLGESDVRDFTIVAALASQALFIETPELRASYLAELARFDSLHDKIGRQFWARGVATDDCDGNPDSRKAARLSIDSNRKRSDRVDGPRGEIHQRNDRSVATAMSCAPLLRGSTLIGCACGWRPLPIARELSYMEAPFASGKYPMIPRAGFAAPVDDQWAVHAAIMRAMAGK